MTQPLTAPCNHCNETTPITFKMRPHPNGIEETYFDCANCGHHYTCFVTDYKVRAQQRRKVKMLRDGRIDDSLIVQKGINERMGVLKHELTGG